MWDLYYFLKLLMFTLSGISVCGSHFRGPHHPKNSPTVAPNFHQHHQHSHYVPRSSPGEAAPVITHDKNLLHDAEHIKEDVGEWVTADGKEMTPEEMEFHYFKMHDFDNNSMLDGLEILQAISHIMPSGDEDTDANNEVQNNYQSVPIPIKTPDDIRKQVKEDLEYYTELIDRVLEEDDMNKDGYLSYFEYVVGRRREEEKEKKAKSNIKI